MDSLGSQPQSLLQLERLTRIEFEWRCVSFLGASAFTQFGCGPGEAILGRWPLLRTAQADLGLPVAPPKEIVNATSGDTNAALLS